ncbi:hypothetical protein BD779DRAFT_1520647 [Infundibulicybe gibba]|nr:hypothetical protein BD779DRAFT_1520647 [Infundibulicybe gibba]
MSSTTRLPNYSQRREIARDTIARSRKFYKDQLPPLSPASCPGHEPSEVLVLNQDAFALARDVIKQDRLAEGKLAVLNLASDEAPGGGWEYSLSTTQEEALCYSSTLYQTLHESYYPWPNLGPGSVAGVFSPGVVIFKDDLSHECADLPPAERHVVSVITVAAPRSPSLTKDHLSEVKLVLRMAAHEKKEYLYLFVADEMKSVLLDPEFKGWFKRVVFAAYSHPSGVGSNYDIFEKTFRGVIV